MTARKLVITSIAVRFSLTTFDSVSHKMRRIVFHSRSLQAIILLIGSCFAVCIRYSNPNSSFNLSFNPNPNPDPDPNLNHTLNPNPNHYTHLTRTWILTLSRILTMTLNFRNYLIHLSHLSRFRPHQLIQYHLATILHFQTENMTWTIAGPFRGNEKYTSLTCHLRIGLFSSSSIENRVMLWPSPETFLIWHNCVSGYLDL